jgi:KDO2-lipid IV(A) lauroyltransferase
VPAYTMTLVHNLLRKTSCEIIIGYAVRDESGFNVFYENISDDIKSHDQLKSINIMNLELENVINKFLNQYEWSYKRFKKYPLGQKNPYH